MSKQILSHIKEISPGEWNTQTNEEHCKGVAELAETFAAEFGFGEFGKIIGLLHDKGKELDAFQKYIHSKMKGDCAAKRRIYHAYIGGLVAKSIIENNNLLKIIAWPIISHHRGLYDYIEYNKEMIKELPDEISPVPKDLCDISILTEKIERNVRDKSDYNHLIRMLFSCLVDADFLDTERFMNKENFDIRSRHDSLETLSKRLDDFILQLSNTTDDSEVNRIRDSVQNYCIDRAEDNPGLYSLTVPTGGGKTISSLVWAIKHALKHNKKRIIIAIPYTSIIVQTAQILRDIFGEENVLEHHSNVNLKEEEALIDDDVEQRLKLATENWDYPIIVTTNVQLFESMYSHKPSRCRKLHNLCNSVLILDEAQTLPTEYLQPIVDGLKSYHNLFGLSVLFTTACQPALMGEYNKGKKNEFIGFKQGAIEEIIPKKEELYKKLKRVNIQEDDVCSTHESIADRLKNHNKVLCVVSTRKDAQKVFNLLPQDGTTFHLSRMMCSAHILQTINQIKKALSSNQSIVRVVSTQIVEAGVDIDFPVVFRQEAGVDSIVQASGRCNREGRLENGKVIIFKFKEALPSGFLSRANNARLSLLEENKAIDYFCPETIDKFFQNLYMSTPEFDTISESLCKSSDFEFETASTNFKLINSEGYSNVIVNWGDSEKHILEIKNKGICYSLLKKLWQYSVSIVNRDFEDLKNNGLVEEVVPKVWFLNRKEQYSEKIGLIKDNQWLEELLIK